MSVTYAPLPSGLLVPSNVRGLKFGTPRDPSRPTLGALQGAFSDVWLGRHLMPHQQYIADVCGEVLPSGLPAYTMCLITLQRQGGKSALAMAQTGERCFSRPGFHAWYTAQKRKDARDQFLSFADDVVTGTPLEQVLAPLNNGKAALTGNGTEVMKFPRGSWLRPHEPSEESLHGKQSDRNDIDEAWAFPKEHGDALIQAIGPTQLTRPGAQTFIWSAGGTAASTWLANLVARGREMTSGYVVDPGSGLLVPSSCSPDARLGGVDLDPETAGKGDPLRGQRLAYFELGIPDDADPEDLDVIAEHHPAYGYSVTMDALAALRTTFGDDSSGWARAAGNRWTEVIGGSIPSAQWAAASTSEPVPDNGEHRGWGTARAEDGSSTAIVTATYAEVDGRRRIVVEVAEVMAGAYGAAERVKGWAAREPIAVVPDGPSATLADALDDVDDDRRVMRLSSRDYSAACANLVDALKVGAWRFRPHPAMDAAAKVVGKRRIGDGGFVWARLASGASINTIEAATIAVWALTHGEQGGTPETTWA